MNTTENIDTIEPDFDDWLAGGERKAHFVTLYGRADLYADIEELERQRVKVDELPEADRGLGGNDDPNRDLNERINDLWAQLDQSKREFRVSARTEEELRAIRESVEEDLKDELEAAMTKARKAGRDLARQLGVTAAVEINNMVRKHGLEARAEFLNKEISFRGLADSTSIKQGGQWVGLTRDQVKALEEKLGGSQMELLNRAYSRAANEAPAVTIPK